jgi:hypothetical protein
MLDALGYRHSFRAFTGEHMSTGIYLANWDPMGEYVAHRRVERAPAHISYVFSKFMHQPAYGLTSDHAYWLSGLTLRDESGDAPLGKIDAFSHGLGVGDPPAHAPEASAGVYPASVGGAPVPYYGDDLGWGNAPPTPKSDTLDIKATNLKSVTVYAARAGLSCHPTINVDSDGPLDVKVAGCDHPARRRCTAPRRLVLRLPRGRIVAITAHVNGRRTRAHRAGQRRVRVDLRRFEGRKLRVVVRMRIRQHGRTRTRVIQRAYTVCGSG